ncbi:hypothetical protein [Streptomyces cyaneofuscatus]|uniref:hypothetical protein n=1 Tax=Streptomyces cyaneofuscatus TaxID=66883 RepID=UPI002954E9B7|nr:hypothetical protein [Streptomyces cyaneofuscatus]WOP11847.1 hypothetical protein R2B67_26370 [Streptomyces cyaneofuscatus]
MEHRDESAEVTRPAWFTGGTRLFSDFMPLIKEEPKMLAIFGTAEPPSSQSIQEVLDFLSDEFMRSGTGPDWEPNQRGHLLEDLIDVFNDLLPEEE